MKHSEQQYDELWRLWGAGAGQSWRVRQAGVVWSSGDVRYRVDRVRLWAGKAASGLECIWMPRTSGYDVSASDMLGG